MHFVRVAWIISAVQTLHSRCKSKQDACHIPNFIEHIRLENKWQQFLLCSMKSQSFVTALPLSFIKIQNSFSTNETETIFTTNHISTSKIVFRLRNCLERMQFYNLRSSDSLLTLYLMVAFFLGCFILLFSFSLFFVFLSCSFIIT